MERVVIVMKPDGVALGLTEEVKLTLGRMGLILICEKPLQLTRELILEWHPGKDQATFWPEYVDFLISACCFLMVWEGEDARNKALTLKGSTKPPTGLRGRYAVGRVRNVIHSSESEEETQRELKLFFSTELGMA